MKPAKFLLLGSGNLETSLRNILQSTWKEIRITHHTLARGESDSRVLDHAGTVKSADADLCFLIPGESLVEQEAMLLRLIKELAPVPVIVVVDKSEPDLMFKLLEGGSADFISAPLHASDVLPRIWRLLNDSRRQGALAQTLKERSGLKQLVGQSAKFLTEINRIPLVAKCDASVLISGETGTGKELCARAVHYLSYRAYKPFVPINCGAIPLDLIENELFGHKRGAFTGATTSEHGLIHEADGGTLLLDEINHLPALAQVKLLRFIQEKEYRPLGSHQVSQADVRIIAAMNVDPEEASQHGAIRQDLFYRLNIISLTLPPLRERREDILLLANHFLTKYAERFQKPVKGFSAEARQKLLIHDWPGNVRELEHVVERAVVLTDNELIQGAEVATSRSKDQAYLEPFRIAKTKSIAQFERKYIQNLLLAYEGNVTRAAAAARKNRRALWELIRKHQIDMQGIRSHSKSTRSMA